MQVDEALVDAHLPAIESVGAWRRSKHVARSNIAQKRHGPLLIMLPIVLKF